MAQKSKIQISYYFSFILYAMVSDIWLFYHSNSHSIRKLYFIAQTQAYVDKTFTYHFITYKVW